MSVTLTARSSDSYQFHNPITGLKDRFQGVLYDWLDVETKAGQSVSSFDVAYFDCASKAGGMAYHTQLYIKFALPFIFAIYFFVIVGIIFAIKRGDSKQASRNKEFRLAVVRTVRNADSHTGVCSCNSPIADPPWTY